MVSLAPGTLQALKAQFKIFHKKITPNYLVGAIVAPPPKTLSLVDNQKDVIETQQHFRFSLLGTEIVCVCVVVGGGVNF